MAVQPYAPFRLERSDYKRTSYFMVVPEGTSIDDVMKPDFWVHTKKQLRIHDTFELVAEDGSFDAVIRCTSINTLTGDVRWRVVSEWRGNDGKAEEAVLTNARFALQRGFQGRYSVVEIATGTIIAEGISKAEAIETAARAERGELAA